MSLSLRQSTYSHEKSQHLEARLGSSKIAAKEIIREHEIITLTARESKSFVDTLLHAPKLNAALKKAAKNHRTFIQQAD